MRKSSSFAFLGSDGALVFDGVLVDAMVAWHYGDAVRRVMM